MSAADPIMGLIEAYRVELARLPANELRLIHRTYGEQLNDVPAPLLWKVVAETIATEHRFPSIAQLRGRAADLILDLPSEEEALQQVRARIAWGRAREGEAPVVHPAVLTALITIGGFTAFKGDNPGVAIGQFSRAYREVRERKAREAVTGDLGRLTLPPGPQ